MCLGLVRIPRPCVQVFWPALASGNVGFLAPLLCCALCQPGGGWSPSSRRRSDSTHNRKCRICVADSALPLSQREQQWIKGAPLLPGSWPFLDVGDMETSMGHGELILWWVHALLLPWGWWWWNNRNANYIIINVDYVVPQNIYCRTSSPSSNGAKRVELLSIILYIHKDPPAYY